MTSIKALRRLSPLAAAFTLAGLTALSAQAGTDQPQQRVTRDAATGQLRSMTADEASALEQAAPRRSSTARRGLRTGRIDPQAITHADGTVELELDDSSLMYSVARRGANGSIDRVCVSGSQQAAKAMAAPTFASKPKLDKTTARGASYELK